MSCKYDVQACVLCFCSSVYLVTRRCQHKVPHLIHKIGHSCADLLSGCVHVFSTKYSHWDVPQKNLPDVLLYTEMMCLKKKKKKKKKELT